MKPWSNDLSYPMTPISKIEISDIKLEGPTQQRSNLSFNITLEPKDPKQKIIQNEKFSMAELCRSFLNKHNNLQSHKFTTQQLLNDFKVKQRRIYDLMNILQGCGCVTRVSKGTYEWLGQSKSTTILQNKQSGNHASLRQISAQLKSLLLNSQKTLSFNELIQLFMVKDSSKKINPASMRRRIYECCKVFSLLGYIKKIGRDYIWSANKCNQNFVISVQTKDQNRHSKLQTVEKKLINQICKRYKTLEDLENFIDKVKIVYQEKIRCQ